MKAMKISNQKKKLLVNLSLAAFFVVCVIAPIVSMLCRITPEGMRQVFSSPQFLPAVKNSLSTAFVATCISLLLSILAALCMERCAVAGKAIFSLLFVLPMLIPSISHAFGLVSLLGTNGSLTNLLKLNGSIYGFWGIVAGSVLYSFPVAFLMFTNILQYEDGMTYKAAEVLGVPPIRRFLDITVPFMKKTLISAFFAVFTMIITDYGVPLMVGGKTLTLSVLMYNKAVAMIDYSSGSVIGALLLLPAIAAFVVDLLNSDNGQSGFVSEPVDPRRNRLKETFAFLYCALITLMVLAPIVSFCGMVFETKYPVDPSFTLYHVQKTLNRGAGSYLLNSVLYATLTAAFGTLLAFTCAYSTARLRFRFSKALHLISITSMAIPGIVLGLSYVIFFHGSAVYGTVLLVVLANSMHFFASPYMMMYNTLSKVNPNLEDVGKCMGVSRIHIIKDVILPKVKYTLAEMAVYFFVNSMMTISAVAFLAPPSPKSVALMITQFEAQLLMESAAFVSLLILIVNLLVKTLMALLRKREKRLTA